MKYPLLITVFSASIIAGSNAAMYSTDFQTGFPQHPANPGDRISGNDGWLITDNGGDLSFPTPFGVGASNALGLGGFFATPATSSVSLFHSYVESVGRITATFDFSIADSDSSIAAGRDAFAFSLNGGSGSLFAIQFTPTGQSPTPESDTGIWEITYSVGGGASQQFDVSPSFFGVTENGNYSFTLDLDGAFVPGNTTTTNVAFTLFDGVTTFNRTRSVALDPTTVTTDFSFDYETTGLPANAGSNFIAADNLTVIPEPSSSLLLALAGLGLVSRRRRA